MTEPRLAELFTGIAAFRQAESARATSLAEIATDAGVLAETLERRGFLDCAAMVRAWASIVGREAGELASGLDTLTRLADGAQDDTLVGIPFD